MFSHSNYLNESDTRSLTAPVSDDYSPTLSTALPATASEIESCTMGRFTLQAALHLRIGGKLGCLAQNLATGLSLRMRSSVLTLPQLQALRPMWDPGSSIELVASPSMTLPSQCGLPSAFPRGMFPVRARWDSCSWRSVHLRGVSQSTWVCRCTSPGDTLHHVACRVAELRVARWLNSFWKQKEKHNHGARSHEHSVEAGSTIKV